ncbi:MAG: 30S ribosomal protein S2 [archaeon]
MPEKEKTILDKTEEIVGNVVEKVSEGLEKAEEAMEDVIKGSKEKTKKTTKKKTAKKESSEKEDKIAKLKEKAKALEKAIPKEKDIKKEIKPEEAKDTLVPIEDYLKSSIHLGTRAITPDMKPYVYKRRADSLAVFNTTLLDEKIKESAEYLSKYSPEDIVVVCKREAGEKAVELFSKTTGIKAFIKKYPSGILTNPNLDNFIETELLFICDPWTDKAALSDARRTKIPVLAICDTNNYTIGVDKVLPGNNKSAKSLGMIFYLMAKLYVEKRKLSVKIPPIQDFVENWDTLQPPK